MIFWILLKKGELFIITKKINKEFEVEKAAIIKNIMLKALYIRRPTLVITNVSSDGCGHILLLNKEGKLEDKEGDFLIIQVGPEALKPAWEKYSVIELEVTFVMWTLETLAYYLKGCRQFDLWTNHNPLAHAMKKNIRELTERMQKF